MFQIRRKGDLKSTAAVALKEQFQKEKVLAKNTEAKDIIIN